MGAETDEKFLANVMEHGERQGGGQGGGYLPCGVHPFHGTGYKLIPRPSAGLGMKHVICVPQQMVHRRRFPHGGLPNPENPRGSIWQWTWPKVGADFILGSDPDADRVGILVRTKNDEFVVISGNQTGVLLLDYLIGAKRRTGKMPGQARGPQDHRHHRDGPQGGRGQRPQCYDTFTGFKFLAEKKDELESSGAGRSSSLMRSPTATCWGTMSGTRTPSPPPAPDHRDGRLVRRPGHDAV